MDKWYMTLIMKLFAVMTSTEFMDDVTSIVKSYINKDMAGDKKRELAIADIKKKYKDYASWLVSAALELSLGYIRTKFPWLVEVK